jgi:hypothetical protein
MEIHIKLVGLNSIPVNQQWLKWERIITVHDEEVLIALSADWAQKYTLDIKKDIKLIE